MYLQMYVCYDLTMNTIQWQLPPNFRYSIAPFMKLEPAKTLIFNTDHKIGFYQSIISLKQKALLKLCTISVFNTVANIMVSKSKT